MVTGKMPSANPSKSGDVFDNKSKPVAIRDSNIVAAKAVADAIQTSLGPSGMDKMIQQDKGDVTITNDGATILNRMKLLHPAAKMMVDLSKAQDVEAGDGTTSVVVIAGNLLEGAKTLLAKGIHPTVISESFTAAAERAAEILQSMAIPVELSDRSALLRIASTSLSSKVVKQYSSCLTPIAVDSVLAITDRNSTDVSLKNIRTTLKLGGTVDECEIIKGLLIDRKVEPLCGVRSITNAKIALIQFCISPPKTDMDHSVIVSDYTEMDRVLREERKYILDIVKVVKASGCNVLLIQKSILRDAINDLALHFFAKLGIMVVKDIERDDVSFTCKTLKCKPIASLDHFKPDMLGSAEQVCEESTGSSKYIKISGIANQGPTVSILLRGSNKHILDEAERSLHDAQCVIRCLIKTPAMIAGGGAPEMEVAQKLFAFANTLPGLEQYCFRVFAQALEVIPYVLSENCGLCPIETVTELRARHAAGHKNAGVSTSKGVTLDIAKDDVVQPILVTRSAICLAAETVRAILKIDDIVAAVR